MDVRDAGGSADKNELVDGRLVQLGILESLLYRFQSSAEKIGAYLFKCCSRDGGVEVVAVEQRVDFDQRLSAGRQNPLGLLAVHSKPPYSFLVARDVLVVLSSELRDEVIHHSAVEVFAAKMSVSSNRHDFKDVVHDAQDGDVEVSAAEIKDENVQFLSVRTQVLLVEAVGDGDGRSLAHDAENVKSGIDSSLFDGLSLRVVVDGRNSDDSLVDCHSKVSFGSLLHLDEDQRGDFIGMQSLGLALVFDLELWLVVVIDDREGPVFEVALDGPVVKISSDESFRVEDRVAWVPDHLVLGLFADQILGVGERNTGGGNAVTLKLV